MKQQKGFTLIELLVVVAIIGILASIVLASLSSARTRAKDAAKRAAVSQARADLELNFLDFDTYTDGSTTPNVCDGLVTSFTASIVANSDTDNWECIASDAGYIFYAQMDSTADTYFCADETGFAGDITDVAFAPAVADIGAGGCNA